MRVRSAARPMLVRRLNGPRRSLRAAVVSKLTSGLVILSSRRLDFPLRNALPLTLPYGECAAQRIRLLAGCPGFQPLPGAAATTEFAAKHRHRCDSGARRSRVTVFTDASTGIVPPQLSFCRPPIDKSQPADGGLRFARQTSDGFRGSLVKLEPRTGSGGRGRAFSRL